MIGFLIGSACVLGLVGAVRRHHGHGGCGGGGRFGGGGWGRRGWGAGGGRGRWGGFGPRFFLRSLFERLDTTPGQEKVVMAAVDELRETGRKAKADMREARKDVATAFRSPIFDENAVGAATARLEGVVDDARKAGIATFAKVHEALDDRQRQMVADMLERGGEAFWHDDEGGHHHGPRSHHPYRNSI